MYKDTKNAIINNWTKDTNKDVYQVHETKPVEQVDEIKIVNNE